MRSCYFLPDKILKNKELLRIIDSIKRDPHLQVKYLKEIRDLLIDAGYSRDSIYEESLKKLILGKFYNFYKLSIINKNQKLIVILNFIYSNINRLPSRDLQYLLTQYLSYINNFKNTKLIMQYWPILDGKFPESKRIIPYAEINNIKISPIPKREIVVYWDIETIPVGDVLIPCILCFSAYCNGEIVFEGTLHYTNRNEFFVTETVYKFILPIKKWITEEGITQCWFIAHNFSNFDGMYFLPVFTFLYAELFCEVNIIQHNRRIYKVTVNFTGENVVIYFICSLKLVGMRLANFNKTYGDSSLFKEEIPFILFKRFDDLEKCPRIFGIKSVHSNLKSHLAEYCINDVKILALSYIGFVKSFKNTYPDLKKLSLSHFITGPRLTVSAYYLKFDDKHLVNFLKPSLLFVDKFIRQGYYGGRTEVIQFKCLNPNNIIIGYDFPGMYSNVMLLDMPKGIPIHHGKMRYEKLTTIWDNYYLFVECEVIVPANIFIPILPTKSVRVNRIEKLYFPVGNLYGVWFSEELKLAVENGCIIVNIKEAFIFDKAPLLSKYVQGNIIIKDKYKVSNPEIRKLAKFLNNSIYGKMGISADLTSSYFLTYEKFKEDFEKGGKIIDPIHTRNGIHLITSGYDEKDSEGKSKTYVIGNVAVAASITSFARIWLWKSVNLMLKEHPYLNFIYSDTDSMFFECPKDKKDLLNGTQLAHNFTWKNRNEYIFTDGIFLCPKTYILIKEDGSIIIKIKGYNEKLETTQFNEIINFIDNYNKLDSNTHKISLKTMNKLRKIIIDGKIMHISSKHELVPLEHFKRDIEFNSIDKINYITKPINTTIVNKHFVKPTTTTEKLKLLIPKVPVIIPATSYCTFVDNNAEYYIFHRQKHRETNTNYIYSPQLWKAKFSYMEYVYEQIICFIMEHSEPKLGVKIILLISIDEDYKSCNLTEIISDRTDLWTLTKKIFVDRIIESLVYLEHKYGEETVNNHSVFVIHYLRFEALYNPNYVKKDLPNTIFSTIKFRQIGSLPLSSDPKYSKFLD